MTVDVRTQHPMLLRSVVHRLDDEFHEHFTHDTLEAFVLTSYADLAARSRVLNHLPALIERYSMERLRAVAARHRPVNNRPPRVLFVCARDAGVAHMAAAFFADEVGERAVGFAAGSDLTDNVDVDVIVTIDEHDVVDLVDGPQYLAWRMGTFGGDTTGIAPAVRDDVRPRVHQLAEELLRPPTSPVAAAEPGTQRSMAHPGARGRVRRVGSRWRRTCAGG